MAASLVPFNKLQIGKETTKGTLVPATVELPGEFTLDEQQDFYRSPYPAGVRANVGGAGQITRKGVILDAASDLTAEDILWPLHTGVLGGVTPSGVGPYTYTFTPVLTTGVPVIDAATLEFMRADGVTNHYAGEVGYALTKSFRIEWAFNEAAKLSWQMFARARQTTTPTAALTPYTGREPLVTPLLSVYLDTTWAGLGGTQLTGVIRSVTFDCVTGFDADYTADGRSDKDFTQHKVGLITGTLQLVMEFDAVGASRFANYRANDLVYIRLINTGSSSRSVQVDGAYRFTSPPSFSADGEQVLMTASLESVYDATGAKTLEFEVINNLTAL